MGFWEDAQSAKQAGMSYGYYVATYGTSIARNGTEKKKKIKYKRKEPEEKVCAWCGVKFQTARSRQRFCSPYCSAEFTKMYQRNKTRRKKALNCE